MDERKKDDLPQLVGTSGQQKSVLTDRKAMKEERKRRKREEKRKRRRHSSGEQSRYRSSVVDGIQQSHLVRNLVPSRLSDEPIKPVAPPVRYVVNMPEKDRDHHEAAESYLRQTPFMHLRESLFHMGHPRLNKDDKHHRDHRHKSVHEHHTSVHIHPRRCHQCLEFQNECICDVLSEGPPKSDWAVLVQPQMDKPKSFMEQPLDWLEELEAHSPVNLNAIAEEKFNKTREVCCFPFNTFQIFSRRDIDTLDFYKKN